MGRKSKKRTDQYQVTNDIKETKPKDFIGRKQVRIYWNKIGKRLISPTWVYEDEVLEFQLHKNKIDE